MSELEAATSDDWSAKATATIVGYVDTARNATTGKVLLTSRLAVYFLTIALVGLVALVLGLVLFVRLLVAASAHLSFVEEGEVWFAYYVIGALFLVGGMLLWRKRGR